jgi:HEAT repeat protein
MVTYFCPHCWEIIPEDVQVCPFCGYSLEGYNHLSFEEKLLLSLEHPVLEQRMLAVQTLGRLGSVRALDPLERIIWDSHSDVYLVRAVLEAVAVTPSPRSRKILAKAKSHPNRLVRNKAQVFLREMFTGLKDHGM